MTYVEVRKDFLKYGTWYVFYVLGFFTALWAIPTQSLVMDFYPLPRIAFVVIAIPVIGYAYVKVRNRNIDEAYSNNGERIE